MIANTYNILKKRSVKLEPLFDNEIEVIIDEETTIIFGEGEEQITAAVWKLKGEEWSPVGEKINIGISIDANNPNELANKIDQITERYRAVVARQKEAPKGDA